MPVVVAEDRPTVAAALLRRAGELPGDGVALHFVCAHGFKAGVKAIASCPEIAEAAAKRDWEFMGHGYSQKNVQKVEDERLDIQKTTEEIQKYVGKRP